jgi:hypothetical protein
MRLELVMPIMRDPGQNGTGRNKTAPASHWADTANLEFLGVESLRFDHLAPQSWMASAFGKLNWFITSDEASA